MYMEPRIMAPAAPATINVIFLIGIIYSCKGNGAA
jgi:hypothetical protein